MFTQAVGYLPADVERMYEMTESEYSEFEAFFKLSRSTDDLFRLYCIRTVCNYEII